MEVALSKDDWTMAALAAIARGGTSAVAVEPLAAQLGATKGSFYWHFTNREALIEAALEAWEREFTDGPIAQVSGIADPAERLTELFSVVMEDDEEGQIDVGLLGSAYDPLVAPVFARVQAKRLAFIERGFRDLGLSTMEARHRARVGYGAFLAWFEQRRVRPDERPSARELGSYKRAVMRMLTGGIQADRQGGGDD
jgi:AcrR family transcriptional regulator